MEKPVVLTPGQRRFLRDAAKPGGARAADTYAPAGRLKELGLIESVGSMVNWNRTWVATAAGHEKVKRMRKTRQPIKAASVKHV